MTAASKREKTLPPRSTHPKGTNMTKEDHLTIVPLLIRHIAKVRQLWPINLGLRRIETDVMPLDRDQSGCLFDGRLGHRDLTERRLVGLSGGVTRHHFARS